jgi:hypothetical protein
VAIDFSGSRASPNRDHGIDFTANDGTGFTIGDITLDKVFVLAPDGKNAEAVFNANRSAIYEAAARANAKGRRILKSEDFDDAYGMSID